jgi:hypothetical protein
LVLKKIISWFSTFAFTNKSNLVYRYAVGVARARYRAAFAELVAVKFRFDGLIGGIGRERGAMVELLANIVANEETGLALIEAALTEMEARVSAGAGGGGSSSSAPGGVGSDASSGAAVYTAAGEAAGGVGGASGAAAAGAADDVGASGVGAAAAEAARGGVVGASGAASGAAGWSEVNGAEQQTPQQQQQQQHQQQEEDQLQQGGEVPGPGCAPS